MPSRHLRLPPTTAGLLALVAACGGRTPETGANGHAVVAQAGGAELTRATLERWMMASPEVPSRAVANRIVASWIDQALLATALQRGPALDDSATADAVIAPDAARGEVLTYWDEVRAKRRPPTTEQVDSLADINEIRVFQQLVVRVSDHSDSIATNAVVARMVSLLRRAQAPGSDFTALVREASEDSASRANNGFLPAVSRAQLDSLMPKNRLWALPPGTVSSSLIRTDVGFHMFRRATRAESAPYLAKWLIPRLMQADDARLADSVVKARHVTLTPKGLDRLRAIAREPVVATDDAPLVTWADGALSPQEARSALMMMRPDDRLTVSDASDSLAGAYLRQIARREILVGLAAPNGVLTARARAALVPQYHDALDSLRAEFARAGGTQTPGEIATAILDSAVIARRALRVFPGMLVGVLRSRYPVRIDTEATSDVVHVVVGPWRRAHTADSAAADSSSRIRPPS